MKALSTITGRRSAETWDGNALRRKMKKSGLGDRTLEAMARLVAAGNARRCPTSRGARGVSEVTASRALRRPEMVSAELRQRVESAVRELAYIPNRAGERARLVAHPYHRRRRPVVHQRRLRRLSPRAPRRLPAARLSGAGPQLALLGGRGGAAIATLLGKHPEAMIVAGIDQTPRSRRMLEDSGVPVVQTMELDRRSDRHEYRAVAARGRRCRGRLLHRFGASPHRQHHRAGRRPRGAASATASSRRSSARASTWSAWSPPTKARERHHRPPAVRPSSITRWPDVEAVFCGNDYLALGCLFECKRRGIRGAETISRSSASTTSNSAPVPFRRFLGRNAALRDGAPRLGDRPRDHPRFGAAPEGAPVSISASASCSATAPDSVAPA